MLKLFRPSGGLLYHVRAMRSRTRWQPFANDLERWLFSWRKPEGKLVLIGPSGGYTLPREWLQGFSKIYAYDIDPLAPFFFKLKHNGVRVHFRRQDVFWREKKLSVAAMQDCVSAHKGAAFLFCNVIGQLPLEHPVNEDDLARYLVELRAALRDVTWASYHDLFTVEPLPAGQHPLVADDFRQGLALSTLGDRVSPAAPRVEIVDHLLSGKWSDGLESERLAWSLNSKSLHLIEGVSSHTRLSQDL